MWRILLFAILVSSASCRYLGDRGLDFLDQFRGTVGVGTEVGVRGRAAGLVDTGIMMGAKPNATALGWKYGKPLFLNSRDARFDGDQAEIVKATSVINLDYATGAYDTARSSAAILPFLLTWTDSTPTAYEWTVPEEGEEFEDMHWIWSKETTKNNRYAQIHAFDVELGVGLGVYAETGFSIGESIDFLLGIFTIDLAKDDGRLGVEQP